MEKNSSFHCEIVWYDCMEETKDAALLRTIFRTHTPVTSRTLAAAPRLKGVWHCMANILRPGLAVWTRDLLP